MIIDTHCHIYASEMENAEEIIIQAGENDIHMIVNGTDPSSNREVLDLSERYDNVHAALGYFYTMADDVGDEDIKVLDEQLCNDSVVAVGEIGLDYYHGKDNREMQKELFERMIFLASKHELPVIVHCRKAMQDTFDILKGHDVVGCLHSYQGSVEMAREFIKLGFYIGVGGSVTHTNNRKVKDLVKRIDINHLLVETDSPYMVPEEKRGEVNTSLNIGYVTGKIAEEVGISENEVIRITLQNARSLFGI